MSDEELKELDKGLDEAFGAALIIVCISIMVCIAVVAVGLTFFILT